MHCNRFTLSYIRVVALLAKLGDPISIICHQFSIPQFLKFKKVLDRTAKELVKDIAIDTIKANPK